MIFFLFYAQSDTCDIYKKVALLTKESLIVWETGSDSFLET